MRKSAMLLLALTALLAARSETVEIVSDRFEADEGKRVTKFLGHVRMKKGSDELNASKVVVYFDAKRKPVLYEASGGTSFEIHMVDTGQYYTGKANRLIYRPERQIYELHGNVVLKEPAKERIVKGEKVIVEKLGGRALVEGASDRPVRFIFKVEERNASKDR